MTIREPAARFEGWFDDKFKSLEEAMSDKANQVESTFDPEAQPIMAAMERWNISKTIDNVFAIMLDPNHPIHKAVKSSVRRAGDDGFPVTFGLLSSEQPADARSIPYTWWASNTTIPHRPDLVTDTTTGGVDEYGNRYPMIYDPNVSVPGKTYDSHSYTWGKWVKHLSAPDRDPSIDVSSVKIPPPHTRRGIMSSVGNLQTIDCEKQQILIKFVCMDGMPGNVWEFFAHAENGTVAPIPHGLNAGWNPPINVSKYRHDTFRFSDKYRKLINEVLYREDMALYRHYCGGAEYERQKRMGMPGSATSSYLTRRLLKDATMHEMRLQQPRRAGRARAFKGCATGGGDWSCDRDGPRS